MNQIITRNHNCVLSDTHIGLNIRYWKTFIEKCESENCSHIEIDKDNNKIYGCVSRDMTTEEKIKDIRKEISNIEWTIEEAEILSEQLIYLRQELSALLGNN